ncbi:nucleotide-binding protein [Caulobacter sp. NIBR2454]|uniref:nucleotide-binding protein n=1 Tax=Caulobacter sp. NIBR2454 TaxID=3015996 RepID=UPI0022B5FD42|nr:P-loop NTPase [Caulobacter sp. NIBR2454]
MKTIAVLSRKGGAGKTTLAINLAIAAYLDGRAVTLADADPQRSATDSLRARTEPGPELAETSAGKVFQIRAAAERSGMDYLFVDTPAAPEAEVVQVANCVDFCILVCRPSFLDIASITRSAEMVRRLGKPAMIVLNQAPARRNGFEAPAVLKAIEALRFSGLPIAPTGLRSRVMFQQAIARGRSTLEWSPKDPAAQEVALLWSSLEAAIQRRTGLRDAG